MKTSSYHNRTCIGVAQAALLSARLRHGEFDCRPQSGNLNAELGYKTWTAAHSEHYLPTATVSSRPLRAVPRNHFLFPAIDPGRSDAVLYGCKHHPARANLRPKLVAQSWALFGCAPQRSRMV